MSVGALIGAYQEDENGALRALLPLAGRTLLEYQVRCVTAAGAAPIIVLVERVPQALQDAFERLRLDGVNLFPVSDIHEAVSRFEAGSMILLIGDGIVPPVDLVTAVADEPDPAIATVPDDNDHQEFERIDSESRWAGIALVQSRLLGSTAAMLGDWDLQSTLLRRTLQDGALRVRAVDAGGEPLLANSALDLQGFQRKLLLGSRGLRPDWVSRFLLPLVEDFATEHLMQSRLRPASLLWSALVLILSGAFCFVRGWLGAGLVLLLASMPLDLLANRLAILRLRPLAANHFARRALWPATGLAFLAIGVWEMQHSGGWGALVAALAGAAFAEAARLERAGMQEGELWLFSRRSAIVAAVPFAIAGAWTSYIVAILAYAAISFFIIQQVRHHPSN